MRYKVSVIVPVYNVEKYIERCAVSLFGQTLEEVEYIFVDDCSPDRSMQILESVALRYPNRQGHIHYVHHHENKGSSTARNSGLSIAMGEHIICCDGDDWVELNMLETMYREAQYTNADIVWCDFCYSYSDHEEIVKQKCKNDRMACIKALLSEKLHGGVWNKLVKRELYVANEIHFPDNLSMWEDLRVSVSLFVNARNVVYLPMAFYHYVQYNANALHRDNTLLRLREMQQNMYGIIRYLKENQIKGIGREINYLKLATKQIYLTASDIQSFRLWRTIHPESNRYIWSYSALPMHLRLVGGVASLKLWPLVNLWIWMKRRHNKIGNE